MFRSAPHAEEAVEIFELLCVIRTAPDGHRASGSVAAGKTTRSRALSQYLRETGSGARYPCQGIFFAGIASDSVFTSAARIHEFDLDVLPDPFEITIAPQLPWMVVVDPPPRSMGRSQVPP